MNKNEEARESYEKVLPMLEKEPRCGRLDWERSSIYINIGNTYSRAGDFESADKYFKIAERLGQDHMDVPVYDKQGKQVGSFGIDEATLTPNQRSTQAYDSC